MWCQSCLYTDGNKATSEMMPLLVLPVVLKRLHWIFPELGNRVLAMKEKNKMSKFEAGETACMETVCVNCLSCKYHTGTGKNETQYSSYLFNWRGKAEYIDITIHTVSLISISTGGTRQSITCYVAMQNKICPHTYCPWCRACLNSSSTPLCACVTRTIKNISNEELNRPEHVIVQWNKNVP